MPIIRSWALTRGFALHPGTRNRYEIRYTRTQHRPPSRQANDHGRVSGTHRFDNADIEADIELSAALGADAHLMVATEEIAYETVERAEQIARDANLDLILVQGKDAATVQQIV